MRHVFIIGSKSIGQYGGFETFVDKLIEYHKNEADIKYHVACKANGEGHMNENNLHGITNIKYDDGKTIEFTYNNAHVYKISVPNIGPAVAIFYDLKALDYAIKYCKQNKIKRPVFYILACRIGPFMGYFKKKIRSVGGELYINPDGHEWKRSKWNKYIRMYWKYSEGLMVKHADLLICDSVNIKDYIREEYKQYKPRTTFIAYGAELEPSKLKDNDKKFVEWKEKNNISENGYFLVVGRLVSENNYETILKEFMKSETKKDLVLITNENEKLLTELGVKTGFAKDGRIKFVGPVYNKELLKKIREQAHAYIHGHEVGGTNPSLLESLGSTGMNLLFDVGFNQEVAGNAAVYWDKVPGKLSTFIDVVDDMPKEEYEKYREAARSVIENNYTWQIIADKYKKLFLLR